MPIKPVSLDASTPEQRAAYVRNFLNLEVSGLDTETQIMAKLLQAQPGTTVIFVNEADAPEDVAAAETVGEVPLRPEEAKGKQAGSLGKGDPRAIIMIPNVESEDGSGSRDVLVGVNGRGWQLKRGVDLPVPWRVVEALQNAVADVVRHRSDEGHEGEVQVTKAKRFNFEFIEKPSAAEIAAWHERIDSQFCA